MRNIEKFQIYKQTSQVGYPPEVSELLTAHADPKFLGTFPKKLNTHQAQPSW